MLDGWYCRSMANAAALAEEEERSQEESKFKKEYKFLKRKFHNLVYENEALMEALRAAQKRLLSITRDRTFLLDRLLLHEKVDNSTSESEETDSSDDGEPVKVEPSKKRKLENSYNNGPHSSSGKSLPPAKKKRNTTPRPSKSLTHHTLVHMPGSSASSGNILSDGHMTPEEVERHLQSQNYVELVPERAPPTVPTEMFSNEPSLDSESNDIGELETSPSNMGEELSIDMIAE
ncbi:uncharacterized protein BDFB_005749 [Asbolus verrucosus]|uniref:INO80 complex subunit E N-terminal domain-containing protein n=1 Tax=Asbolus verrucosus TaxID=1661398 RepID=A0A482WDV3_ASBVE|nr:uncharacterized protein BDFB_005749 [Asbolus verrucosus]